MPFSFQLLVEFFFPGLILLTSFLLMVGLVLPAETKNAMVTFQSCSTTIQIIYVFVAGLVCYFLGAVINGVSNRFIRVGMARFRRDMIRRKLGLKAGESIDCLPVKEKAVIDLSLPILKSQDKGDRLNELYAAARTYSAISSDRAGKLVDYHWSLVRLSRATLLPLGLLEIIMLLRWAVTAFPLTEGIAALGVFILLMLTFINYQYREKFLVYTTFDLFFLAANRSLMSKRCVDTGNSGEGK